MYGMPGVIVGDVVLMVVSLSAAWVVRFQELSPHEIAAYYGVGGLMFCVVNLFFIFLFELYLLEKNRRFLEAAARTVVATASSFLVLSALFYIVPSAHMGRGVLGLSLVSFAILQLVWHFVYFRLASRPGLARRVLVLGTGATAAQIGRLIHSMRHSHTLTGYVSCAMEPVSVPLHHILGDRSGLMDAVSRGKADKIIVSLSEKRGVLPLHDMLKCKLKGVEVLDAPTFYEQVTGKLCIENITPSWLIFSDGFKKSRILSFYKRALDILLSLVGLVVSAPLFPFLALAVKLDSHGPVFFRQSRVGEGEKPFELYKIRTMSNDAEEKTGAVWAAQNDPRVTRTGKFMRKTRLDELPQLFNILRGDMSIVGPRPERPEFVEKLKEQIPYYSERHSVKPGLTGWAQVRYPYGASVEEAAEKLRFDLYYIKNMSMFLDTLIILETVKVVLFGRGGR